MSRTKCRERKLKKQKATDGESNSISERNGESNYLLLLFFRPPPDFLNAFLSSTGCRGKTMMKNVFLCFHEIRRTILFFLFVDDLEKTFLSLRQSVCLPFSALQAKETGRRRTLNSNTLWFMRAAYSILALNACSHWKKRLLLSHYVIADGLFFSNWHSGLVFRFRSECDKRAKVKQRTCYSPTYLNYNKLQIHWTGSFSCLKALTIFYQ